MKELNITLYEIFGYVLPGAIATLAVSLFYYIFTVSGTEVVLPQMSKTFAALIGIIAYFSGHIVQTLGNIAYRNMYKAEDVLLETKDNEERLGWFLSLERCIDSKFFGNHNRLPKDLLQSIAISLSDIYKIAPDAISGGTMYKLCDAYVLQNGNVSEREVYTYREGFYRGLSISCFMLVFATLCMCFLKPMTLIWINTFSIEIRLKDFLFVFLLASIGSILFYYRYKRFYNYRIVIAVTSFVALIYKGGKPEDKQV